MTDSLYGNIWIRYLLEGSLDIAICCALNYIHIKQESGGFTWDNIFQTVNNIAIIVLGFSLLIFPFWAIFFYCCKFKKWKDEQFDERYGSALEGLKKDKRSSLGYPIIFTLRRLALVFVVTIGSHHLFA